MRPKRQTFARFVRKRAIVPIGDGRFYLDEPRWAQYSRNRMRGLALYCAIVVVVVITLIVIMP
ncbi:MAG: hypothetical protein ABJD07_07035 [Gemmatimonadaceae bacterium]